MQSKYNRCLNELYFFSVTLPFLATLEVKWQWISYSLNWSYHKLYYIYFELLSSVVNGNESTQNDYGQKKEKVLPKSY